MERDKREITLTHSNSGLVCSTAGGGASGGTTEGQWIVDKAGKLKPAIFLRTGGDLSNRIDQAIVPVVVGDFIVSAGGRLPADLRNPDFKIEVWEIVKIEGLKGFLKLSTREFPLRYGNVYDPMDGLTLYHNRDGRYFAI